MKEKKKKSKNKNKFLSKYIDQKFLNQWFSNSKRAYISHPITNAAYSHNISILVRSLRDAEYCVFFPDEHRFKGSPEERMQVDIILCTSATVLYWDLSFPSIGATVEAYSAFLCGIPVIGIRGKKNISEFSRAICCNILNKKSLTLQKNHVIKRKS